MRGIYFSLLYNGCQVFPLLRIAMEVQGDPPPRSETEFKQGPHHDEEMEEHNRAEYDKFKAQWEGSDLVKMQVGLSGSRLHAKAHKPAISTQVLKRKLSRGVTVICHGYPGHGGSTFHTRLFISETHFFWENEEREDPTIDRNQVCSYRLRAG